MLSLINRRITHIARAGTQGTLSTLNHEDFTNEPSHKKRVKNGGHCNDVPQHHTHFKRE